MATVNGTEVVKGKQLRQGSINNWIPGSCIIDVRLQVSSSFFFDCFFSFGMCPPVDILDTVRRQMNDVAVGGCRPCIYKVHRVY